MYGLKKVSFSGARPIPQCTRNLLPAALSATQALFPMAIHIGCGSWTDSEYVGVLYPKGVPSTERLRFYAQCFDRVELNNTYYNTPSSKQMAGWAAQTPPGFIFDVKLHNNFSQDPASAAQSELIGKLHASAQPLLEEKKLGVFLLTLAPSFGPASHRLDELDTLVEKLPPRPLAVELRDRGWVEGEALASTLDYFRRRKLVWVALDLPRIKHADVLPPIDEVTNPYVAYMRLHGRNPDYAKGKTAEEKHRYDYPDSELTEIAARVQSLAARAKNVHVSLNNHAEDFAPKAARKLRQLLGQPAGSIKSCHYPIMDRRPGGPCPRKTGC
jgi:uncharacterized protein YecE (DUF72 family)